MSFFPPTRPYPGDRYEGPGEASAVWRPADSPPDLEGGGGACHYLLTGDRTGGDVGLYRGTWGLARVLAPPRRTHAARRQGLAVEAPAGDFVYVPPGGIHGFRNDTDVPVHAHPLRPGRPTGGVLRGAATHRRHR